MEGASTEEVGTQRKAKCWLEGGRASLSHLLGSLICVLISRNATVGMWCLRKDDERVCVCDLPWLRVSWLVSNDRLTLSCTPHPPGPPHTPHPTHPSALERHQIFRPVLCLCHVGVCACGRVSRLSFCHSSTGRTSREAQENSSHAL